MFIAESEKILFPGYLILDKETKETEFMGVWHVGEVVPTKEIRAEERSTQPPPSILSKSYKSTRRKGLVGLQPMRQFCPYYKNDSMCKRK